jgi:ATP phosphoribosyltransferase
MEVGMIKLGIPKGRHLFAGCEKLFAEAGIPLLRKHSAALTTEIRTQEFAAAAMLLPPRRMLILLARGRIEAGILGLDVIRDGAAEVEILAELPCARLGLPETRVVLFAGENDPVNTLDDMPPSPFVLTEYMGLTREFLEGRGIDAQLVPTPGGCEAEVPSLRRFGVAVVDTGTSLMANNLKVICTIATSKPVLAVSKTANMSVEQRKEIYRLAECLEVVARS